MEYRTIKENINTSLLGFGCMRFPTLEDGTIDEKEAERMIDLAISKGVNYIDTAYPYHNGESEPVVGRVLKKYPRDSFYLATKLPVWKIEKTEDVRTIFNEQMERLQMDYVDFYLLHALNKNSFEKVKELGLLEECIKLKEEGKIKYLGFSFHDNYEAFEEIIKYYPFDFCQIQYNYMDYNTQATEKGYDLAKEMGVPMVIMEPIKGGSLASLPEDIEAIFKQENSEASIASWALRYVGSKSNVKVILSGMSTYEQVEDNLKTFENFKPLSTHEYDVVKKVEESLRARVKNDCTGCRYCVPCPMNIEIPRLFSIYNEYGRYDNLEKAKERYGSMEVKADACVKCGKCEEACPQHISIRKDLEELHKVFK